MSGKSEEQTWQGVGDDVLQAGRSLWLFGVGAVAALGEAGGRVFEELVERGERFDKRQLVSVRGDLRRRLERVGDDAKRLGSKLGAAVEEKVEAGLVRLGVPTRDDVEKLAARVEQLNRKIDRLAAEKA